MPDPLSITCSVVALLQAAVKTSLALQQFYDEVGVVDLSLEGLLGDVDEFKRVLESMNETLEQDEIQNNLRGTGHVGNHWSNLERSLKDGNETLRQLQVLLESVNKTTKFLNGPRKQLRFQSAANQIVLFRERIQSYRGTLQLSLTTVMIWNQVNFQKSTVTIPEKILPSLDKLYDEIRHLGTTLNSRIETLQKTISDHSDQHELNAMRNLKETVRSAVSVISSASTTLGRETSDKMSEKYGSDFGDIFPKEENVAMVRWMESSVIYEYEDTESSTFQPSLFSVSEAPYESDSDSEIEHELIKALMVQGQERQADGDLAGAERHFQNCLKRLSLTPVSATSACCVSKSDVLDLLTDTYCLLESWDKAKSCMVDKLLLTERQVGSRDERFLWNSLKLAVILEKNNEDVEAHLQGRRSLRGFKKLGEAGYKGYAGSLELLVRLCRHEGKEDEEDAYAALLGQHYAKRDKSAFVDVIE